MGDSSGIRSGLQCVAAWCSVLQCVAVRAVCCSVLQCVAVCCSALQCDATRSVTRTSVCVRGIIYMFARASVCKLYIIVC